MKYLIATILVLLATKTKAQTPQIARVSSDGITTVIYTDLKKALKDAQNDDFIYLPGGTLKVDSVIIDKRINLVGTGIYPDSTNATRKTVITGTVYLNAGRDGGSLQGVEINNSGGYGLGNIIIYSAGNFTISKSKFNQIYDYEASSGGNISIKECVVSSELKNYSTYGNLVYNVANSIINDNLGVYTYYAVFTNCIFLNFSTVDGGYNEFRNCIFHLSGNIGTTTFSRYFNSHIENSVNSTTSPFQYAALELNTTYDGAAYSTFVGGPSPTTFNYTFDFHIKSSSAAVGSGTDGTDKGIYGSMNPYNPNPYNPHIYFQSIAPTTNAQGQLQINVKVKAQ